MTPMKIAIIVGKMDSGGKKNLIMEYYRHIDRDKIQFDFICDSDSQAIPEQEILELGGNVYKISPYQHIVRNMADMAHIFQQNKYKVVHAYNSTMNLFPMAVAKYCNVPVRISESLSMAHEGDWKTILKKILRPMSRLYANYYMSCGEDCGRWQFGNKLFDTGKVDVFKTVINTEFNSYDRGLREKTRVEFGWEDKIVIGHIGRFTAQKNSVHEEDKYIKIFLSNKDNNVLFNAKESYVMGKMYALFVSEEVLEPSMDNEMILTGVGHNKGRRLDRTLGTLIKTDFAKKEIISEYMKIIDIIFCKLNIRNCIMHGLGETFDYLNIGIVAIMFQLLWDVAACEIFND